MHVILDEIQICDALNKIAGEIAVFSHPDDPPALVGIRSRGEVLARRLQQMLSNKGFTGVDFGALDISLYRDDLNMGKQPEVQATEIDFGIDDRVVVLVDDVLNTGRSARAALDALIDLGRPKKIALAVLIDRGNREFPIRADYIGKTIEAPVNKRVNVYLRERDQREEVTLE